MKQTAVEWYAEQEEKLILEFISKKINDVEYGLYRLELLNKAKEMEKQQQDEFAIGFAEWNSYKYKYLPNKGWFGNNYELFNDIFKSSKELLEIYKKENEL